jgi:L-rhamnose mutarotase
MIRKAFIMQLNAGQEEEYQKRHEPIWPELESTLKSHGVHSYSIFFDPETLTLFATVEFEDESQWTSIAKTEVCQRWWKYMRDVMPSNPDNSPVSKELKQMFQLG